MTPGAISASAGGTSYVVHHQGQTYSLTLRVGSDGFFTAREEAAVQLIVQPFMRGAYTVAEDLYADEFRVSRVLSLVVAEAQYGGWIKDKHDGDRDLTPFPWLSWYDLPLADIRAIVEGFFFSVASRTRQSTSSTISMNRNLVDSISYVSLLLIQSTTMP